MMLIVWFIALFPAAITAQESPDRRACNISDTSGASAKVAGCTRLIESGSQTPHQTAISLANRAMAYTWQNDIAFIEIRKRCNPCWEKRSDSIGASWE